VSHPFSKLLLATEHSEQDEGAETLAFTLAQRCGLPLRAVLPIASNPEYEAIAPQLAAHAEAQAGERIGALLAGAKRAGLVLELQARRGPEPWREIVDEAAERGTDLLVIRRRGQRGLLANLLVGEMVRNVVTHVRCSVLVVPRGAAMWCKRVLVAIEPETADMTPVVTAATIATECGLPLTLASVADATGRHEAAERTLRAALAAALEHGVSAETRLLSGRAHERIVEALHDTGADLLVIGRHRAEALPRAWLGDVAQKVIGLAERPVLVCASPSPTPRRSA
jgi:nucleotide-binding universal stress UspA family protein